MEISILQTLSIFVCTFALWTFLRSFLISSPLSNIAGPPSPSWWKGNFGQVFNSNAWAFHEHLAKAYGSVVRIKGFFGADQLFVFDPLALHHIVVKDQYIYEETAPFLVGNKLIFGSSLISTLGEHHRKQRKMLNPVFSPKHMRDLVPTFYPIAYQLRDLLVKKVSAGQEELDMTMWMGRAAMEYIGQGGMGYSFDSLDETKTNRYHDASKNFGHIFSVLFALRPVLPYVVRVGSPSLRRKFLDVLPIKYLQKAKVFIDVMHEESISVYESRKAALLEGEEAVDQQIGKGKDILSILLKANMASNEEDRLPEEEVVGQINTFIFAGHDTTTLAISRILHQLCLHQDVQEKLRNEVKAARKHYGDPEYETLMGLPFLDAVCRETLRVFPPLSSISRTTRKDVVLPLMFPMKSADGKSEIREIPIKKNTNVIISILSANRNKAVWGEDAEEWKPERWLGKTPDEVAKARLPGVYSSMMTFLGGGRACIGFKFSELEMKIVLFVLLQSFIFSPGSSEIEWVMRGLATPIIKNSGDAKRTMPMKLALIRDDDEA